MTIRYIVCATMLLVAVALAGCGDDAPPQIPGMQQPLPAPVPPPIPVPVPAPMPAAPVEPAPVVQKIQFPIIITCATCSIGVEVPESGNFKCPRCSTVLYVDGQGKVSFFAPKKRMPIQMTLLSSPECTASFLSFFGTMSTKLNIPKSETNKAMQGIEEVLGKIAQEAYLAKPSTFQLLFDVKPDELVIKTSDHGRMLNGADAAATFPIAAGIFDELEITTHPKGGNLVRMVKKLQ